jgi:hypothetical protein
MNEVLAGSNTKRWAAATSALRGLFADPRTSGLSVALTFFPVPAGCESSTYENPAVPFGELEAAPVAQDVHEATLTSALIGVIPGGSTTTIPAMEGTLNYMIAAPKEPAFPGLELVLVTDGQSGGCGPVDMHLATGLAKKARAGPGKVISHAVGIGEDVSVKDMVDLAAAGDGKAVFIETSASLETVLYDALVTVTRGCTFRMSSGPARSVALTEKNGGETPLQKVDTPDDCKNVALGWYLDSQNADHVVLCPAACERASDDGVDVIGRCGA